MMVISALAVFAIIATTIGLLGNFDATKLFDIAVFN